MKKILFVCLQKEIIEDLNIASMMDMDMEIELTCYNSISDIDLIVTGKEPDLVVLSYDALKTRDKWDFKGIPIAYHAKNEQELKDGARYGFPTIGVSMMADEILEDLKKPTYKPDVPLAQKKEVSKKEPPKKEKQKQPSSIKKQKPVKKPSEEPELMDDPFEEDFEEDIDDNIEDDLNEEFDIPEEPEELEEEPETEKVEETIVEEPEPIKPVKKEKKKTEPKSQEEDIIVEGFRKDSGKVKGKTKVVTVYSAKGGVGKTTIASELATYLALVNVGRRRLRVCIVDYNIDFGDVRSTIHMGTDGMNLTNWAEEVQELMEKGKRPEDILYSRSEIEEWLRKDKKSGLYVLPAPITNEDSMGIETDSLSIILDNIIENGDFDYVICDTGNNTRDSTMVALEKATTILLIMTQNVNTANCDKAFIETMKSIDFDLSHTKLVINNIMPQKSTGVSVQEIVEFFPYDCVGKLKYNPDVIKAGNYGEPLAFQPEHEFTKQLRNIVSYVLQEGDFNSDAKVEKKKSFLQRLFKK